MKLLRRDHICLLKIVYLCERRKYFYEAVDWQTNDGIAHYSTTTGEKQWSQCTSISDYLVLFFTDRENW
jgi:hypothetical protein